MVTSSRKDFRKIKPRAGTKKPGKNFVY